MRNKAGYPLTQVHEKLGHKVATQESAWLFLAGLPRVGPVPEGVQAPSVFQSSTVGSCRGLLIPGSLVRVQPLEPHEGRLTVGPRTPNPPMSVRFRPFVPFQSRDRGLSPRGAFGPSRLMVRIRACSGGMSERSGVRLQPEPVRFDSGSRLQTLVVIQQTKNCNQVHTNDHRLQAI